MALNFQSDFSNIITDKNASLKILLILFSVKRTLSVEAETYWQLPQQKN
jgi:hypothetical protein